MNHHERAAVRSILADLAGQKIIRAELADDAAVGITTEAGVLIVLAQVQRTAVDVAPRLHHAGLLDEGSHVLAVTPELEQQLPHVGLRLHEHEEHRFR